LNLGIKNAQILHSLHWHDIHTKAHEIGQFKVYYGAQMHTYKYSTYTLHEDSQVFSILIKLSGLKTID